MNKLFKKNDEIKRRVFDRNINKDMQITFNIYQKNKKVICYSSTKNACVLEFAYHLWLPFLDQRQSDTVFLH